MSQRHKGADTPRISKVELRAHAHAERHRVKGELHAITNAVGRTIETDDCDEPAVGWKPAHHHDAEHIAQKTDGRRGFRHWKLKQWKRRTALRRNRIVLQQRLIDGT